MNRLDVKAWLGLANLLVVLGATMFGPAWTVAWPEAWAFLGVFGGVTAAVTAWLVRHDRGLLERRVAAGPVAEPRARQKLIQAIASVAFVALFVGAGLAHRAGARLPLAATVAGDAIVALGLGIVFLVFRANSYTSATIEVAAAQRLITTGPYARVRHPMYAGALLMLAGVPLALGALVAYAAVAAMIAAIVWRLLDEERLLVVELPGYADYRARVRHRLVPHVW